MPLSYKVLKFFAYVDVIVGTICIIPFLNIIVGAALIDIGLLVFVLLGIWNAVERSAVYLRKIALKAE